MVRRRRWPPWRPIRAEKYFSTATILRSACRRCRRNSVVTTFLATTLPTRSPTASFFPDPTLLVGLRRQRASRMVGQLHFAGIARKSGGLGRRDIEEHLVGVRGYHVDRAITYLHGRPLRMRLPGNEELARRRQAGGPLSDYGFQPLDGFLIRRSADISRAVIVIVGVHAADFSVLLDACGPVALIAVLLPILLRLGEPLMLVLQGDELLNVFRI